MPAAHGRRFADASAAEGVRGPQRSPSAREAVPAVDGRVGNGAGDAVADSAESIEAPRRVSFARYLAEGPPAGGRVTSLLQVGTCENWDVSRWRAAARRRGRARGGGRARPPRSRRGCRQRRPLDPKPQPPPIGALLVRLINVGRRGGGGGGGGIALEKKKASAPIRAAPDSGGELAASLRAGAVIAANERSAVSAVSASTPPRALRRRRRSTDTRAGARDALEAQETRKLARRAATARRFRERGVFSSRVGRTRVCFRRRAFSKP